MNEGEKNGWFWVEKFTDGNQMIQVCACVFWTLLKNWLQCKALANKLKLNWIRVCFSSSSSSLIHSLLFSLYSVCCPHPFAMECYSLYIDCCDHSPNAIGIYIKFILNWLWRVMHRTRLYVSNLKRFHYPFRSHSLTHSLASCFRIYLRKMLLFFVFFSLV